ncbi:MAG: hypothetical protein H6807_15855 [Planctomycetes bacterium]|nr:hypothetical protein [Planctomycetota bacterium]
MNSLRVIAALFALGLSAAPAAASGGWWDDIFEEKTVSLETILKNPEAFRGLDVSFVIQFHKLGQIDNPYYTPFEKERYLNFSVWADGAALWEKKVFEADFAYMFIDRIAEDCQTILQAGAYERFVVTGRVVSVFRGQPWIEVVGLKGIDRKLDEPTLIRMVKAYKLKSARRFDAAAGEFKNAFGEKLPEGVQHLLHRESGLCFAAAHRYADALVPLEKTVQMDPKDEEAAQVLAQCKKELESMPVPVSETGEKDAESK